MSACTPETAPFKKRFVAHRATYPTTPNLTVHSEMRREVLEVVFVDRGSFAVMQKLQLKHVLCRTSGPPGQKRRGKWKCPRQKRPGVRALQLESKRDGGFSHHLW